MTDHNGNLIISTETIKFIEYLNRYKNRDAISSQEFGSMVGIINNDFAHFRNMNLVGRYNNHPLELYNTFYLNLDNAIHNSYYQGTGAMYTHSITSTDTKDLSMNPEMSGLVGIGFINKPVPESIPVEKIHTVNITKSVVSFSDLICIIDENEYREDTTYNINLESLHKIRSELTEMNNMIGMKELKISILGQLLYFVQNLHEGATPDFKHTIIYGDPGTGKTEIAQIIGRMYSKIGILKNNIFRKVSRSDLVAGFLGQTAIKTRDVVNECIGGCLFIDEVYSLGCKDNSSDIFSKECIDTLCQCLSEHRDDLMVIIAGYEDDIRDTFFSANRGLESRFIWRFKTERYTHIELMQIFTMKVNASDWTINCESDVMENWFHSKREHFKFFGRDMEMLFSYTKISHGKRAYSMSSDVRRKITLDDLNNGFKMFCANTAKSNSAMEIHCGLYV